MRIADVERNPDYGKLDQPYIIAIDVQASLEITRGNGFITVSEPPEQRRSFWALYPKVSGVLLVDELFPWSCARKAPVLWHNAQATRHLDTDLWKGPQRIWDNTGKQWADLPGTPIRDLFGLPATWPNTTQL